MRGRASGNLQTISSALAWTKDQFSPIIASDADNTVSLWGPVRSRWADVKGNLAFFLWQRQRLPLVGSHQIKMRRVIKKVHLSVDSYSACEHLDVTSQLANRNYTIRDSSAQQCNLFFFLLFLRMWQFCLHRGLSAAPAPLTYSWGFKLCHFTIQYLLPQWEF